MPGGTNFPNHLGNTFLKVYLYCLLDPVYSPGSKLGGEAGALGNYLWYPCISVAEERLCISVLRDIRLKRYQSYCSILKSEGRFIKSANSKLKLSFKVHLN